MIWLNFEYFLQKGLFMQAKSAAQRVVPTAQKLEPRKVFADAIAEAEKLFKKHPLLSEKISAAIGCADPEMALSALTETIHYLDVVYDGSLQQVNCAPSEVIDEVWHTFLLFTRPYQDFCYERYGKMIHHVPEESESVLTGSFDNTVRLLTSRLGVLNPVFWNTSTSYVGCDGSGGNCSGGT